MERTIQKDQVMAWGRLTGLVMAGAMVCSILPAAASSIRQIKSTERKYASPAQCLQALSRHKARVEAQDRRAGRSVEDVTARLLDDRSDTFSMMLSWEIEARIRRYECDGGVLRITDTAHLPSMHPPIIPPPPPPPPPPRPK